AEVPTARGQGQHRDHRDRRAGQPRGSAVTTPGPRRTTPGGKPRARALGIPFGGRPGANNAITDVPGVEVGYLTLLEGDSIRTGVTAIHPRGPGGDRRPGCPATGSPSC